MRIDEMTWVSKARELGTAFAERAAAADRDGSFVAENYRQLKAERFFSAGIPRDLGGGGASLTELCEAIRELGRHCASTALAFSMHSHLVATTVWRHRQGQPGAELLKKVAASELVLLSTGAGDWLDSTGSSVRVEGGYRVTAQKRFASGGPAADLALTSFPYADPKEGLQVLHCAIPLKADGVRSANDWDTLGMRGTGSHTLMFEGVLVPDAAISARRPSGVWVPALDVICTIAMPVFCSAYVGLAEAAADAGRRAAQKRSKDPILPRMLGEMENGLVAAQLAWRDMVAAARDYDCKPDTAMANAALIRKTLATEGVQRCVGKAVEVTSGSAFFRGNPLERLWRDAQAMQFHPLPPSRQLEVTGRLSLGLPPFEAKA